MSNDERLERGLRRLLDPEAEGPAPGLDELARRRFAEGVLDGFDAGDDLDVSASSSGILPPVAEAADKRDESRAPWLAVAAAAAIAVLGLGTYSLIGSRPQTDGVEVAAGETLEVPAGGRLALELESRVELWLAGDSVARVRDGGNTVELVQGVAVARVSPREQAERFRIETSHGTVEVVGTLFAVEVQDDVVSVRVHEGLVRVVETGGSSRELSDGEALYFGDRAIHPISDDSRIADRALIAGDPGLADPSLDPLARAEVPVVGEPVTDADRADEVTSPGPAPGATTRRVVEAPAEPKASLDELVLQAASQRSKRKWKDAATTYRAIRKQYAGTPEACTATLSLGQLQLSHLGEKKSALKSFQRHAKECRGPEREESRFGEAQALRTLGRTAAERDALRAFVDEYPGSLRVSEARVRLADLDRRAGRCRDARRAYDEVLGNNPGSTLERQARFGIADCDLQSGDRGSAEAFVKRYPEASETRKLAEQIADGD